MGSILEFRNKNIVECNQSLIPCLSNRQLARYIEERPSFSAECREEWKRRWKLPYPYQPTASGVKEIKHWSEI